MTINQLVVKRKDPRKTITQRQHFYAETRLKTGKHG